MSRFVLFFIVSFLLTIFGPATTELQAWSGPGHRIIAALSWSLLTPEAQAQSRALLRGKTFVSVAGWADYIREKRPETASFHMVNIPLGTSGYDPVRDESRGPSIITAIASFQRMIGDTQLPEIERREALKYLIHFVGDIHQPLHCSSNNDRGGNETMLHWSGKTPNLHHFWDYEMVAQSGLNELQYVARLKERLLREDRQALATGTLIDWAHESFREAASTAYQLPLGNVINAAYIDEHLPLVETKLLKAGVRLARLLNEIWP